MRIATAATAPPSPPTPTLRIGAALRDFTGAADTMGPRVVDTCSTGAPPACCAKGAGAGALRLRRRYRPPVNERLLPRGGRAAQRDHLADARVVDVLVAHPGLDVGHRDAGAEQPVVRVHVAHVGEALLHVAPRRVVARERGLVCADRTVFAFQREEHARVANRALDLCVRMDD